MHKHDTQRLFFGILVECIGEEPREVTIIIPQDFLGRIRYNSVDATLPTELLALDPYPYHHNGQTTICNYAKGDPGLRRMGEFAQHN